MKISKEEVKDEIVKYTKYSKELEGIVDGLRGIRNTVDNDFEGRTRDEIYRSIRDLENKCNDLKDNYKSFGKSLSDLEEDIIQEERRQERIRREKADK